METSIKKIQGMEIKFDSQLIGKYIRLQKSTIDDAQFIFGLRKSQSGKFLRQPINYDVKSQKEWMKNRPNNEINYIIVDRTTNSKVGTIGIYDVNVQDKVANVGRLLLEEKFLKMSTPYGLESLLLTYTFVFDNLNFRKITGDILRTNVQMFKFQTFLGMEQEGLLKEHVLIENEYVDLHILSLTKRAFEAQYKRKIEFLLRSFASRGN
jgi:RimJ/RimL family protein N-acetyltransferase